MNKKDQERADAMRSIKSWRLKPGETVYTSLKHCSRSGMYRVIDVFIMRKNKPIRLSWNVAKAIGFSYDRRHEGIGVGGCGMDMGFHVVYKLGSCLWPHGTRKPHSTRNGEPDTDGGYALKQRWL